MFNEVAEDFPHIQQNPKFDEILMDIVDWAVKHPGYSKADMAADLKAAFGEDKERLKTISRKVEKTQASEGQRPDPKPRSSSDDIFLFSDLS
jgi:hypothetical protein